MQSIALAHNCDFYWTITAKADTKIDDLMNCESVIMRNILVIGVAGYIESHACKALRRADLDPVTFDNFSTG